MMKLSEPESGTVQESRSPDTRSGSQGKSRPASRGKGEQSDRGVDKENPKGGAVKWLLIAIVMAAVLLWVGSSLDWLDRGPAPDAPTLGAIPARYDADRAMRYLVQICDLGPRPSGSAGMKRQQELLQTFFQSRGGTVRFQTFEIRHPEDRSVVAMANLIASWHPKRAKRFLICAHYDTRPYPDSDPRNKRGIFVGANDGASGTAALMELAHQLDDLPVDVGVDLVLFDAEEFVWQQGRDDYFLGSTFFAEKYRADPPEVPYQAGVLLDMVGDRELKIYYEQNSLRYARDVAKSIWRTAESLGVRAFIPRTRHRIEDDHIPLNQIAGIPTVDLIDFDYPRPGFGVPSYWHTEQDIPANCSGESIAAVVWVVHEWLKRQ